MLLSQSYLTHVLLASAGTYEYMGACLDCEYFWKVPSWSGSDADQALAKHVAAGRLAYLPAVSDALQHVVNSGIEG